MTNNREPYQSISLKQSFFEMIQQHIRGNPRYRSAAEFVRFAILDKIDQENNFNNNYQPKQQREKIVGGEEK